MTRKHQIYSPRANDQLKEPMFFGSPVNVARFDQQKYNIFEKLTERQNSLFWRETEIDVTQDKHDFANLPDNEQHIFTANIRYQILLDSVQGRGPVEVLLPICSLPEVEGFILAWSYFESIHSRGYSHLIRNVYNNPSEVFDNIVLNPEIAKRAKAVTDLYDNLIVVTQKWREGQTTLRDAQKALLLCLASINILEGVRFFVSFACSFAFAERRVMMGNASIIKMIARDESVHLSATQHMFKLFRSGAEGEELKTLFEELTPEIRQITIEAAEQEKEWTEYLFQDGSMIGLNKKILDQYVEHITDQRLMAIGLAPEFGNPKNPIPWINTWLSSSSVQVAPQETEITSYLTSAVDSTINEDDFSDMEL